MSRSTRPIYHGLNGQKDATLCGILRSDAKSLHLTDGYSHGARELYKISCKACKRTKEYKQLHVVYEESVIQDREARRTEQGRPSPEDLETLALKALPWVKYLKTRRVERSYTSEVFFGPSLRVVCRGAEWAAGGGPTPAPIFEVSWVGFYTGMLISPDFDKLPALRRPLTSESLQVCCDQLMDWLRAHYTQGEYRAYSALMGMLNVGG